MIKVPPVEPIPIVAPAYLLAGGALIGILLTVTVQILQSRIQRSHENRGRAFDIRIEVYGSLMATLDDLREAKGALSAALAVPPPDVTAKLNRLEKLNGQINQYIGADGKVKPAVDFNNKGPQIQEVIAEHKALNRAIARDKVVAERRQKALTKAGKSLDRAYSRFKELNGRLNILSDGATIAAATTILERHRRSEELTIDDIMNFRQAAREELGLQRRVRLRPSAFRRKKAAPPEQPGNLVTRKGKEQNAEELSSATEGSAP